jgi:hypothetical protein
MITYEISARDYSSRRGEGKNDKRTTTSIKRREHPPPRRKQKLEEPTTSNSSLSRRNICVNKLFKKISRANL